MAKTQTTGCFIYFSSFAHSQFLIKKYFFDFFNIYIIKKFDELNFLKSDQIISKTNKPKKHLVYNDCNPVLYTKVEFHSNKSILF